jgi:hypothetical protein
MVHACATKFVQTPSTLVDYVQCMMKDNYNAFEAGRKCAEIVGIDWAPIQACSEGGKEGDRLLAEFGDKTHALRPKVSFIPTVQVNGSQDGQKDMQKNLLKELCRKFQVR